MKELFLWLIVILGLIALLLYAGTKFNESAADKYYAQGRARAMIIEAQGQARLDTTTALMPYLTLGLIAIFGSAILILAVVILREKRPVERIETRYIILLPQGSKRQMYQALGRIDEIKLLKG